MSSSALSRLLDSHLGLSAHHAGLVSSRAFRAIYVTAHRPQVLRWTWNGTMPDDPYAVVLFPTGEGTDGTVHPIGRFVPPSAVESIEWSRTSDVIAVWIPAETLREFVQDTIPYPLTLHPTPMVQAFRAFTLAIARPSEDTTPISRYAIERLLAEMVFGALLEARSPSLPEREQPSLLERAQSTMLLRREDPEFTVADLAAELHVSMRHLQRAFAKTGTTPGDMLRHLRAELASALLRNADYAVLTVEEIAGHAGFTSGLQLRRALRAEGMPTPTMIRPVG